MELSSLSNLMQLDWRHSPYGDCFLDEALKLSFLFATTLSYS